MTKKRNALASMLACAATLAGCERAPEQNNQKPEAYFAEALRGQEAFSTDEAALERALRKALADEDVAKLMDSDDETILGSMLVARKLDRLIALQTEQNRLLARIVLRETPSPQASHKTTFDANVFIRLQQRSHQR